MDEQNFNALAAQNEALSLLVLHLIAELETCAVIDGKKFTSRTRDFAETWHPDYAWLPLAKGNVHKLLDHLDDARKMRRKMQHRD